MQTEELMKIKAQFRVTKVAKLEGPQEEVTAIAHYGTGAENNDYSKWTPSGEFKFTVTDQTHVFGKVNPGDFFVMEIAVKRPSV
jgi:hypothetical protein